VSTHGKHPASALCAMIYVQIHKSQQKLLFALSWSEERAWEEEDC
jgi:hypothetical protein